MFQRTLVALVTGGVCVALSHAQVAEGPSPAGVEFQRGPRTLFIETFDGGQNEGGWSYFGDPNNSVEVIEVDGGNAGAWLHSTCNGLACLDTFAPRPRTLFGTDSVFHGDYRERGVSRIGIDLITLRVDFSAAGRPLALMLLSDAGTPNDFADDITVYRLGGKPIPQPGQPWRPFTFRVPSASTTLPPGWVVQRSGGLDDDAAWNAAVSDVDQVRFFYGDPELFFIFQQWEVGLDNPRITFGSR